MTRRVSLVLIDDNPLACVGLVAMIRAEPGFQVLATSVRIPKAVERVRQTRPDLVLLSLPLAGDLILALAGALRSAVPASRVIVMGFRSPRVDVVGFVRAGVSGFIMGDASSETLLSTIRSVARGMQILPPALTSSLFGQLTGHPPGRRAGGRRCLFATGRPAVPIHEAALRQLHQEEFP